MKMINSVNGDQCFYNVKALPTLSSNILNISVHQCHNVRALLDTENTIAAGLWLSLAPCLGPLPRFVYHKHLIGNILRKYLRWTNTGAAVGVWWKNSLNTL